MMHRLALQIQVALAITIRPSDSSIRIEISDQCISRTEELLILAPWALLQNNPVLSPASNVLLHATPSIMAVSTNTYKEGGARRSRVGGNNEFTRL